MTILKNVTDPLAADNTEQLVLYDGPASPCCRRCRITMIEKGLNWDTVYVNIAHMEQRGNSYLSLNPNGLVPTLRHGTRVLFESGVINDYLEAQFPDIPLMPEDAEGIALVRQWQAAELSMARVFRPVMYAHVMGPLKRLTRTRAEAEQIARQQTEDPWDIEWELKVWSMDVLKPQQLSNNREWLLNWLKPLERQLGKHRFVISDKFTQADVSLYPRIDMYPNAGLEISPDHFPNVVRWMTDLKYRDSFAQSATEGLKQNLNVSRSEELELARQFFAGSSCDFNDIEDTRLKDYSARQREAQGVDRLLHELPTPRRLPPEAQGLKSPHQRPLKTVGKIAPPDLFLYGRSSSPEQRRVSILLNQLKIPYQQFPRIPDNLELITDEGCDQPPLLEAGKLLLSDAGAIAVYLFSLQPKHQFYIPLTSYQRATHDMWLALESGSLKEFSRLRTTAKTDVETIDLIKTRISWTLHILENQLTETNFLCGDQLSFADLAWLTRIEELDQELQLLATSELRRVSDWLQRSRSTLEL